jgi:NAD(P)-dependent dehydrogenase (short-subunit alcohol dehydrogenase family)
VLDSFVEAGADLKLAVKVALVTGSMAGIGFAIARVLCLRIMMTIIEKPLPEEQRLAGEGTIEQIQKDLQ